jgi:hypothetical protein
MPVTPRPFSPLVALALLALGLAFTAVPLWNLLDVGPFLWHIGRPGAVQGGAELITLVALVFAATLLPGPRWRAATAVALITLYLRRHAVDVPTLLVMVYLERWACSCCGSREPARRPASHATCTRLCRALAPWR